MKKYFLIIILLLTGCFGEVGKGYITKKCTKEETINKHSYKQYDLFSDIDEINNNINDKLKEEEKDDNIQKVIVDIKNKYGKNAILKGMNLENGATAISRNKQIGGHSE